MRIVTYNIQFGTGRDGRVDLGRIAAEVAGADVIALQEVERFWTRSGNTDQVAGITALLPDYYWVYGPGVDIAADTRDADGRVQHRRKQFGNMLLARQPIRYARHHLLPKYASLGPISVQRSAMEGIIGAGDACLRLISVHLTHLSAATRRPQIETLLATCRCAQEEGPPVVGDLSSGYWSDVDLVFDVPRESIIMGDFNCEPDSAEYEMMVGPWSPYGGRMTNPQGFADAWVAADHAETDGVTAEIHGRPVRFDYCFVSTGLCDRVRSVHIDDAATGSDHQPVWLELDWSVTGAA